MHDDMAFAKSIVWAVENLITYEDKCLEVRDLLARVRIAAEQRGAERMQDAAAALVQPTMNKRGPFAMVVSSAIRALDPRKIGTGHE